ncbi:MAG: FtsX-like permease family protein, partial [Chloroflexi bacterium]|nr:FtsX-like permease family protein [Chloroflexota bacterium]
TITITSTQPVSGIRTEIRPLTTAEAEALADPAVAPSVAAVASEYRLPGVIVAGGESLPLNITGASPNYAEVQNWDVQTGAFVTPADDEGRARVAVLGRSVVEFLYGDRDFNPVGLPVEINGGVFTVSGVMAERDGSGFGDPNEVVFVPLSTAQSRLDNARVSGGGYEVSLMTAVAHSPDDIDLAVEEISAYLRQAHEIEAVGDEDFAVSLQGNLLSSIGDITGLLTVFLAVIAGIALLVGGIGVMNIMLVSVTERTREIGLRKAVGARGSDILWQFLIESILLAGVGGALGIVSGGLLLIVGGLVIPDLPLGVSADAVVLATTVSGFIGIFFGLYPANRAARMRPIDALRFE